MARSLMEIASRYGTLSITGNCKNAGKTTVLNYLIDGYKRRGEPVAVTSVGLDGESVDAVTYTKKPRIYLYEGSLFATAYSLLARGDVSAEILYSTGISTPLGEVCVFRAKSDGYAVLAGPSASAGLALVCGLFRNSGAERILLDGAINRKSLAAPAISDTTVFCVGASFSADMSETLADASFACELFGLPASGLNFELYEDDGVCFADNGGNRLKQRSLEAVGDAAFVVFSGALTDRELRPLAVSANDLSGVTVSFRDASRCLLSRSMFERLKGRGVGFSVLRPTVLAAVAANPFSAYGTGYDSAEFVGELRKALAVPVFNVKGGAR